MEKLLGRREMMLTESAFEKSTLRMYDKQERRSSESRSDWGNRGNGNEM
jgi:hypothetical protein